MNPLADSFEIALVRRVFLWVGLFLVAMHLAGVAVQFLYDGSWIVRNPGLLAIRLAGAAVTAGVLIWVVIFRPKDSLFFCVPPVVMFDAIPDLLFKEILSLSEIRTAMTYTVFLVW